MPPTVLDRRVAGFRRFNRFYTQRIGALTDHFLRSPFTLAESRVLWELAQRPTTSPGELSAALEMDPGYLTRLLTRFEQKGYVTRRADPRDGRRWNIALTGAGRRAFRPLDERQRDDVAALLAALPPERQERVVRSMQEIMDALAPPDARIRLRDPEPGDWGWIVERHGAVYADEYGFDVRMEGEVAEIVAHVVSGFDPARDRCWIAERDGVRCGSVVLVHEDATTARLRLLLLEPFARGTGLGRRLVRECVTFARATGYRRIVLWTHAVLTAARELYRSEGFVLIASATNDRWGEPIVSETWELRLDG